MEQGSNEQTSPDDKRSAPPMHTTHEESQVRCRPFIKKNAEYKMVAFKEVYVLVYLQLTVEQLLFSSRNLLTDKDDENVL